MENTKGLCGTVQLRTDCCRLAAKKYATVCAIQDMFSICGLQCAELRIKIVHGAILYMCSNSPDTRRTVRYRALSERSLRRVMTCVL